MVPLLLFIQEILTVIVKATLGRESELDIPGHWTGVIPEIYIFLVIGLEL